MPTAPVAALSLVIGFGVAEATGVRALGGVVLALGVVWCALRWRRSGTGLAAGLVAFYLAAFVVSHLIADAVGRWGAVVLVAAAVGLAAYLLADRRQAA